MRCATRSAEGRFIAVAAGNDYENGNPVERLAEQAGPIDGAVVVAAVGRGLTRAYYSGVKSYVEIAAPGGDFRAAGSSSTGMILQQTFDCRTFAETYTLAPTRYRRRASTSSPMCSTRARRWRPRTWRGFASLLMSQGIT